MGTPLFGIQLPNGTHGRNHPVLGCSFLTDPSREALGFTTTDIQILSDSLRSLVFFSLTVIIKDIVWRTVKVHMIGSKSSNLLKLV